MIFKHLTNVVLIRMLQLLYKMEHAAANRMYEIEVDTEEYFNLCSRKN